MFKVGDKVRCINNVGKTDILTVGNVYKITRVVYSPTLKETFVCLKNHMLEYGAYRFEKVLDSNESEELQNTLNKIMQGSRITGSVFKPEELQNTKRYKTNSGKQLFDVLEDDLLTYEELRGFYKANIYKYTHRYKQKNGIEDLKKVKVYVDQLIKLEEKQDEI